MAYITLTISAILAIIAGLLVLFWPKAFRVALGIYLLLVGILQFIDINFQL